MLPRSLKLIGIVIILILIVYAVYHYFSTGTLFFIKRNDLATIQLDGEGDSSQLSEVGDSSEETHESFNGGETLSPDIDGDPNSVDQGLENGSTDTKSKDLPTEEEVKLSSSKGANEKAEQETSILPGIDVNNLRNPFEKIVIIPQESETSDSDSSTSTQSDTLQITPYDPQRQDLERDTTYEDLLRQIEELQGLKTKKEPELEIKETVYPPYILTGIVSSNKKYKAILNLNSRAFIVSSGQKLDKWTIVHITDQGVILKNQEEERFILTLEGVAEYEN